MEVGNAANGGVVGAWKPPRVGTPIMAVEEGNQRLARNSHVAMLIHSRRGISVSITVADTKYCCDSHGKYTLRIIKQVQSKWGILLATLLAESRCSQL